MDKEVVEKKQNKKIFLILEIVIGLSVNILIALIVILIDIYGKQFHFPTKSLMIFGDGFAVAGVLTTLFWCLLWVSRQGAFDMIVYGTKKLFSYLFKKNPKDGKLPDTYYDYVVLKRGEKHRGLYFYLIISATFMVIGIILSILSSVIQ